MMEANAGKWNGRIRCRLLSDLLVHHITKPIPAQIQLLHSSMMLWVLGNRDGTLVVYHQENMTCLFLSFLLFLSLFAYYELKSELRKNTDM